MAHYRKVDTRIWNDKKFHALSLNGKLIFFYLLTHPHLTSLGAMRATETGMASELGISMNKFKLAFSEILEKSMVIYDNHINLAWLPNFLKYNVPESPNVIKSWATALEHLPEGVLTDKIIEQVKTFVSTLSPSFQEALPECFQKTPTRTISNDTKLENNESSELGNLPIVISNKKSNQCRLPTKLNETINTSKSPVTNDISDIFLHWKTTLNHPNAVLDKKRQWIIQKALKLGYQVDQLCQAIDGCSKTPHNMGQNEQGQRYDGLHIILRDADQIERFIRNAHTPPRPQTVADRLRENNIRVCQEWLVKSKQHEEVFDQTDQQDTLVIEQNSYATL